MVVIYLNNYIKFNILFFNVNHTVKYSIIFIPKTTEIPIPHIKFVFIFINMIECKDSIIIILRYLYHLKYYD